MLVTKRIFTTIVIALSYLTTTKASRILAVIPTASFSHQVFYRPIWKELANRGHELVLITTDPMQAIPNLRQIDVSIAYDYNKNETISNLLNSNKLNALLVLMSTLYLQSKLIFSHPDVKQLYKNESEHFDLLMIECILPTSFAFIRRFNVPVIGLSSLDADALFHRLLGNPTHYILYPSFILPFIKEMNFVERLITVALSFTKELYNLYSLWPEVSRILEETLDEKFPNVLELGHKIDMLFTNSNPLFNAVRPYAPATISIAGGLHETIMKPLPKDLQEFLDNASEGAIYFSLGSNVNSNYMALETRHIITETFRQLPFKILWKFEDDKMPNKPENVKISKWVSQQDVLRHKNIRVFVTQAGLQSMEEALYARVPMIAIPYFADQDNNARRMADKGLGLWLDRHTLTVDTFKEALLEVIHNDKYKKRIIEIVDIMQDEPMKPLEKAIWWTEYVLRHKGAQHLKGPTIPAWQHYCLDIFAFFGVVLLLIVMVVAKIVKGVRYLCRQLFRQQKEVNSYQNNNLKSKRE